MDWRRRIHMALDIVSIVPQSKMDVYSFSHLLKSSNSHTTTQSAHIPMDIKSGSMLVLHELKLERNVLYKHQIRSRKQHIIQVHMVNYFHFFGNHVTKKKYLGQCYSS